MNRTNVSIAALIVFNIIAFITCVKPPDYPKEPVIAFKNQSKFEMKQGKQGEDSMTISLTYTDGDGDLGFPGNDSEPSIFVKDGRDGFPRFQYKLPYVEPQGTGNGISGEISIVVPTACCIETNAQGVVLTCKEVGIARDTLVYLLTIKDRAGHISNEIQTDPIVLLCQ